MKLSIWISSDSWCFSSCSVYDVWQMADINLFESIDHIWWWYDIHRRDNCCALCTSFALSTQMFCLSWNASVLRIPVYYFRCLCGCHWNDSFAQNVLFQVYICYLRAKCFIWLLMDYWFTISMNSIRSRHPSEIIRYQYQY